MGIRPPIIRVANGKLYDADAPNAGLFTLENIAIGMGNTCRWSGHLGNIVNNEEFHKGRLTQKISTPTKKLHLLYYSTAEHSVLGARYFLHRGEEDLARLFLMHDALEPFTGGDIPTPLKANLELVNLWEQKGQVELLDAYDLEGDFSMIADVDKRICRNESICMFGDTLDWAKEYEPLCYEKGFDRTLIRTENWTNQQAANEWYVLAHKLELKNKYVT